MCAKLSVYVLICMSVKRGLLANRRRSRRDIAENIVGYERGKTREKK